MVRQYMPMLGTMLFLVGTLVIGRFAIGLQARTEGYSFTDQAFEKDNPAVLIRLGGLILALLVAAVGAYRPVGVDIVSELTSGALALVAALAALVLSRFVNDRMILHTIDNTKAIVEQKNIAIAIVEAATYLATAYIFASGMKDPSNGFIFNLAWFVIGQLMLVGLARLYAYVAPSMHKCVTEGSPACALSLAGTLLAGGIAIGASIQGVFDSWLVDIGRVLSSLVVWLVLMAATFVGSQVIVPRHRLVTEMTVDHNWALGLVEAAIFVGVTIAFVAIHQG